MAVYSVSQITAYLRAALERDSVLQDAWISGEVSNLSASGAGHLYFTLKDAESQLRCVMFRFRRGGELLNEGGAVLAHGLISFYEARGDLRFYVDLVQPEGVGELSLKLAQLKVKLEEEGLFEPSRKRSLPPFPRRIGVVTSPAGAVWHDIQNVIRRRYPLVELLLAPTPVQGDGAAAGIVETIVALNEAQDIDVVIVARGGGSLEELWPFNEEAVARAIYASRIPVVSAVGHETDVTIADLVADLRAPTPSAAAELVVPDRMLLHAEVSATQRDLVDLALRLLQEQRQQVQGAWERLAWRAPDTLTHRQRVDDLLRAASMALNNTLALRQERAQGIQRRLAALDPAHVLERGYAVVQREDTGEVVSRVSQADVGDTLTVTVTDGALRTEVREESAARVRRRKHDGAEQLQGDLHQ